MFMHMKREVLRLCGYAREFFVSQMPELTEMADVVIDVEGLADHMRAGGEWRNYPRLRLVVLSLSDCFLWSEGRVGTA
jgi:hypothetical protein